MNPFFLGSVFTTVLIVLERKLYERKSGAFLQLHADCNNRKQNSYFCSCSDKNSIVGLQKACGECCERHKLLSIAWSWLGNLDCGFYSWWQGLSYICHLLQEMVKMDKLAKKKFLLIVWPCRGAALDTELETESKGKLPQQRPLKLQTAVPLLPQVEGTRAKRLVCLGNEGRESCLFHCGCFLLSGSTGYKQRPW